MGLSLTTDAPTATFISRHALLRLVRKQRLSKPDGFGGYNVVEPGCRYEFDHGTLTLQRGQDMLPDGPNGEEQDAIDWLRGHKDLGVWFHEDSEPLPRPADFLRELNRASVSMDADTVRELRELEESGHQRADLLSACDSALEAIEEARIDPDAAA